MKYCCSEIGLWWIYVYNKVRFKIVSFKSYYNNLDKIIGFFKYFFVIVFYVFVYFEEWVDLLVRVYEVIFISYVYKVY